MANDLERTAFGSASSADPERVCFSNEIGIDFPFVPAVVSRVRDAFLASAGGASTGSAAPIKASISLSMREALRGRDVVLTLPLRRTCAACGGRGEVWNDACVECCGLGDALDQHDIHVAVPAGVRDGTRVRLTVSSRQTLVTHVDLLISVT
jgi:DnaJ-class molecular chaperone